MSLDLNENVLSATEHHLHKKTLPKPVHIVVRFMY
jgi:hypothetical protein